LTTLNRTPANIREVVLQEILVARRAQRESMMIQIGAKDINKLTSLYQLNYEIIILSYSEVNKKI